MRQSPAKTNLVSDFVIVGLSPKLDLKQLHQNNFITSISITSTQKVHCPNDKILQLSDGMFLHAVYGQAFKSPLTQIEVFDSKNIPQQWFAVEHPPEYDISGQVVCCRKAQDILFERIIEDVSIVKFGQYSSLCSYNISQMKNKQRFLKLPSSEDYLVIHYSQKKNVSDLRYKAEILERYSINQYGSYLQSLAQYCFPKGIQVITQCIPYRIFNFILTTETGERLYCTCLESTEQCSKQLSAILKNIQNGKNCYYYCEKVYIIISKYKYVDEFSESLQNMYLYSMHSFIHESCNMKDLIRNFVDGLILPYDPEKLGIKNKVGSKETIFDTDSTRPHSADQAIYALFRIMDGSNILKIFKALLLQRNIFLVSSSKTVLGLVTQALLDLIFPFRWEHALIPILPEHLTHFIQSPIPIIAGLNPESIDQKFQRLGLLVYLDNNIVNGDHFLQGIKFGKEQNKLRKSLKKYDIYCHNSIFQFFESNQNPSFFRFKKGNNKFEPFELNKVKNSFLTFLRQTVRHYQQFVAIREIFTQKECVQGESRFSLETRSSKERAGFQRIFRLKQFRSKLKLHDKKEFARMFTETSMFSTFIQRYYQNPQDMQFKFFNNQNLFEQDCDGDCQAKKVKFSCVNCVSKEAEQIIQRSLSLQHIISRESSIDEPPTKKFFGYEELSQISQLDGQRWKRLSQTQRHSQKYIDIKDEFQIVDQEAFYKSYWNKTQEECLSPVIDQSNVLLENDRRFTKTNRVQEIQKTLTNNEIISMLQQQRIGPPLKIKNRQKLADQFYLEHNQMLFNTIEDIANDEIVLSQPLLNSQRTNRLTWAQLVCQSFGCITLTAVRLKYSVSQWLTLKKKKGETVGDPLRQEQMT